MRLYHFTSTVHWPHIREEGLSRGDVPTSIGGGFNAVWFTTTPTAERGEHGLDGLVDKTAVRIAVDFEPNDEPELHKWSEYARKHVDPLWAEALDRTGGGLSHTWFFYRGTVAPIRFASVAMKCARTGRYIEDMDTTDPITNDPEVTLDAPQHPED